MIIEVYLSKAICINSYLALFHETSADVCEIVTDSLTSRVWQFRSRPYKRAARSHVSYRHRNVRKRRCGWFLTQTQLSFVRKAHCMCTDIAPVTPPHDREAITTMVLVTRSTNGHGASSACYLVISRFSSSLLSTNAVLPRERETRSACRNFRRYFRRDKTSHYKRELYIDAI